MDNDHGEVGSTGGEGFPLAVGRWDLQDGVDNEAIRDADESQGGHECYNSTNEDDQLIDVGFCTRKLDNWQDVTEIVVDLIGATERELKD